MVWVQDCGPLEVCYLGLAQDGSERSSAFWSELVVSEAANRVQEECMLRGADKKANTIWIRVLSSLLERGEGRVALESLCKSSSAFWSELVHAEAASEGACKVHVKGR